MLRPGKLTKVAGLARGSASTGHTPVTSPLAHTPEQGSEANTPVQQRQDQEIPTHSPASSTPSEIEFEVTAEMNAAQQAQQILELRNQLAALQNQVAAPGGAAAAAPAQPRSVTVPEFSAPSEQLSAELWISNLNRQQTAINATDAQMLNAALCALKGTAGRWREGLELSQSRELTDFTYFKTQFSKRFGKDRSATDLLALLRDLSQKNSEPVRDFADRINVNLRTLCIALQAKLPDEPDEDRRNIRNDGYSAAFNNIRSLFFCSGLRDSLRAKVEPKFAETDDFHRLIEIACEFERTSKEKLGIASLGSDSKDQLQKQLEDSKKEIAALKALTGKGRGQKPKNNNGSTQQQGQPGSGEGKIRYAQKISKLTKWKYCKKCQQWGKHGNTECRANKTSIEALTPMDEEVMPSGPVTDWYFDELARQGN